MFDPFPIRLKKKPVMITGIFLMHIRKNATTAEKSMHCFFTMMIVNATSGGRNDTKAHETRRYHAACYSLTLIAMLISRLQWICESGPADSKHTKGWAHPIVACLLHYFVVVPSTMAVHDAMVGQLQSGKMIEPAIGAICSKDGNPTAMAMVISNFFACYAATLLLWRLVTVRAKLGPIHQRGVLYEYTWLCNSTLVMVSIGLRTCRPILASSFCVAVSIDQLLWWVDLVGWTISGFATFPIGVAKYLTWPNTSFATRITATHHLWTIPLTLHAVGRQMHWSSYLLSVYVVTSHVLLSRWLTPFTIRGIRKNKDDDDETKHCDDKYLNVNLSHEVWKDIKFGFVQIKKDNPSTCKYLFRLLLRWNLFNCGTFVFLYGVGYFNSYM